MFYYLNSIFYTVVYCTHTSTHREDWKSGLEYWKEIAAYITKTELWKQNKGIDFLVSASHPKSGPNIFDPTTINDFIRITFLRTDYDFTGNSPKDVIVPYFAVPYNQEFLQHIRNTSTTSSHSTAQPTIVFLGGDNPHGGLRHTMEKQLHKHKYSDVLFTTQKVSPLEYRNKLITAEFCLSVRGDTASTSRLFSIISSGCIPVIISDWLHLPYESIIDYNSFSIRFSESIANNVEYLVQYLRNISIEEKRRLKKGVEEAKALLLYEQGDSKISLLNPVTLTLIEMLQRREKYCNEIDYHLVSHNKNNGGKNSNAMSKVSTMCDKIKKRMTIAKQILATSSSLSKDWLQN